MLRLRLLGGASLWRGDEAVTGAATQRHRLALLALLASAGEAGVGRERLIAWLWPESDAERGRRSLAQAVYALRRSLGEPELVLGTRELRLNPAAVGSDLGDFEAALAAGDLAGAVSHYGGPFLDGFHLRGAPEFERWVDGVRDDVHRRLAGALESVARAAEGAGDAAGAVDGWRRLAALEPLSGRVTLSLMRALAAAGDRGGAVQLARAHELVVRAELGIEPDASVTAFAAALGEDPGTPVEVPRPVAGAVADRRAGAMTDTTPGALRRLRRRGRPALAGAGAAVLAVALLAANAGLKRQRAKADPADAVSASLVAVFPFTVHGEGRYGYLREGMAELMSRNLDGAAGLRAVDPNVVLQPRVSPPPGSPAEDWRRAAAQLGAGVHVLGGVVQVDGRLRLSASVYGPGGELLGSAQTEPGDEAGLFALADDLARRLLATLDRSGQPELAAIAATTTASLPAFRFYLEGEAALREGRFSAAVAAFQLAVAADSQYALAHHRLASAASWSLRWDVYREGVSRAWSLRDRLPERHRLLVEARHAVELERDGGEAERLFRILLDRYPDDAEGWEGLAELLFHNGHWGHALGDVRTPLERLLALRPGSLTAISHLARIAAAENRRAALDSLVERGVAVAPDGAFALELVALRAALEDDEDEWRRAVAGAAALEDQQLALLTLRVGTYTGRLDRAGDLAELMTRSGRRSEFRAAGHVMAAHLEASRGRRSAAAGHLAEARVMDRDVARFGAALSLATPFPEARWLPPDPDWLGLPDRSYWPELSALVFPVDELMDPALAGLLAGLTLLELAGADRALAEADAVEAGPPGWVGHGGITAARILRAGVARAMGDAGDALAILGEGSRQVLGSEDFSDPTGLEPFLRAELLRELGRHREALRWYGVVLGEAPFAFLQRAPAHLRSARIHDELGDPAAAAVHYRRFLDLWRDADPDLRPLVDEVRARLRAPPGSP